MKGFLRDRSERVLGSPSIVLFFLGALPAPFSVSCSCRTLGEVAVETTVSYQHFTAVGGVSLGLLRSAGPITVWKPDTSLPLHPFLSSSSSSSIAFFHQAFNAIIIYLLRHIPAAHLSPNSSKQINLVCTLFPPLRKCYFPI